MDNTSEYIEMCGKATEIQDEWKPQAWDYLFCLSAKYPKFSVGSKGNGKIVILSGDDVENGYYGHGSEERNGNMVYFCDSLPNLNIPLVAFKKYHLFLPRQDQLQEMVELGYWIEFNVMPKEMKYLAVGSDFHEKMAGSMEQLWLAFAMKQKFGKAWNAEKKEWEKK